MVVMESTISDLTRVIWSQYSHYDVSNCAVEYSRGLKRIDHL